MFKKKTLNVYCFFYLANNIKMNYFANLAIFLF